MIKQDQTWSHVFDNIVKPEIEKRRNDLETCADPLHAAELRGEIRALRALDKLVRPDLPDTALSSDNYGKT